MNDFPLADLDAFTAVESPLVARDGKVDREEPARHGDARLLRRAAGGGAVAPAAPGHPPAPAPAPQDNIKTQIEQGLSKIESAVVDRMEQAGQRLDIDKRWASRDRFR